MCSGGCDSVSYDTTYTWSNERRCHFTFWELKSSRDARRWSKTGLRYELRMKSIFGNETVAFTNLFDLNANWHNLTARKLSSCYCCHIHDSLSMSWSVLSVSLYNTLSQNSAASISCTLISHNPQTASNLIDMFAYALMRYVWHVIRRERNVPCARASEYSSKASFGSTMLASLKWICWICDLWFVNFEFNELWRLLSEPSAQKKTNNCFGNQCNIISKEICLSKA